MLNTVILLSMMVLLSKSSPITGPFHLNSVAGTLLSLNIAEHMRNVTLSIVEEVMVIIVEFEMVPALGISICD